MKTIVIDAIFFQMNEWSGIAKYWTNLLNDIDSYLKECKNEITIYLLVRGNSRPLRNKSFKHINVLPIHYWDQQAVFSDYIKLGQLCEDLSADVFISTYYTLAYGVPNIGMAYDFIPERLNEVSSHPSWLTKYVYMKSLKNILSISKSTSYEANLFYPNLRSSSKNIFYPHINKAETKNISDLEKSSFRSKHHLKFPYIAVVGHRGGYKNVDILKTSNLDSVRSLPLGIVFSSGEEISEDDYKYYNQVFTYGVHRFKFDEYDMTCFLHCAEMLFYPSLLEGFGYPILEAMVQGCPVITTGSTSINEILENANESDYKKITGFCSLEAYQAIQQLMNSRKRVHKSTIENLNKVFCKNRAHEFITRVFELAKLNEIPRDDYLSPCSVIDAITDKW